MQRDKSLTVNCLVLFMTYWHKALMTCKLFQISDVVGQDFYIASNIQVLAVCTMLVDCCVTFMRAIESRADGSLCFQVALAPTLVGFVYRWAMTLQVKWTNKHMHILALLWSFSVDLTFSRAAPQLVNYVQYLYNPDCLPTVVSGGIPGPIW